MEKDGISWDEVRKASSSAGTDCRLEDLLMASYQQGCLLAHLNQFQRESFCTKSVVSVRQRLGVSCFCYGGK